MSHHLQVDLVFSFVSAFHVTGERAHLWADKTLVMDWQEGKRPLVPATTLKGWLRESAERLLRGLGHGVCDSSRAHTVCGSCLVCMIFGSPRRRSPLYFFDALLEEPTTDVRMNVSLSRYRKAAYEERLFSTEVAWSPSFRARIEGWFSDLSEARKASVLIVLAAKASYALGAARSRGLGWARLSDQSVKVDGEEIPHSTLLKEISNLGMEADVAS